MALFSFTEKILEGSPTPVFNFGNHTRDFTFVADIVEGVLRASDQVAEANPSWDSMQPDPATSNAPFRIFNIGDNQPVKLTADMEALGHALGKKAILDLLPLQAGDVPDTYANVDELAQATGYRPNTSVQQGIASFVEWYRSYFRV